MRGDNGLCTAFIDCDGRCLYGGNIFRSPLHRVLLHFLYLQLVSAMNVGTLLPCSQQLMWQSVKRHDPVCCFGSSLLWGFIWCLTTAVILPDSGLLYIFFTAIGSPPWWVITLKHTIVMGLQSTYKSTYSKCSKTEVQCGKNNPRNSSTCWTDYLLPGRESDENINTSCVCQLNIKTKARR